MSESRRGVVILGGTGSVGTNTLRVIAEHPERFSLVALTAHTNVAKLFAECIEWKPSYAVMSDSKSAAALTLQLKDAHSTTTVLSGVEGLEFVATLPEASVVVAAIVGAAGLRPTFAAARKGKTIILANKEVMVAAGALFVKEAKDGGATIIPIDSEHNAIFQSLPSGYDGDMRNAGIRRLLLTASGGPFRKTPISELASVTPNEACAHPNWKMGRKISVDSATMMNKGLEVIEAHFLFNAKAEDIDVVIHPQSIIHSMVEYTDGSILAQLGNPDMRTPIAHALGYPDRLTIDIPSLDMTQLSGLTFEKPDLIKFPSLRLAYEALKEGGSAPAILNAANEIAVGLFLDEKLRFTDIAVLVEDVLTHFPRQRVATLDDVLATDEAVRHFARDKAYGKG